MSHGLAIDYRGMAGAGPRAVFRQVTPRPPKPTRLAPRQERIVSLLAAGYSIKEAADKMGVTYGTANQYLDEARQRTGMSTTVQLVVTWARGDLQ